MAFDPLGVEAAAKAFAPMVDAVTASIDGAVDRLGTTVITFGPITIPEFKITVTMPPSGGT